MQPTTNEESSDARIGSQSQPTREQEEYALGFSVALSQLYAQRGVPMAVRVRSQSSPLDPDPTMPSNSTPSLSAVRSRQLSLPVASSQSLPSVLQNVMMSTRPNSLPSACTTIPLCVARLESNVSDDHLLSDEPQRQQPICDRTSTGKYMNKQDLGLNGTSNISFSFPLPSPCSFPHFPSLLFPSHISLYFPHPFPEGSSLM